jgi:hypothetical protein
MPVTVGCAVVLSPGASGPPDSGFITNVPQTFVSAAGQPLAVAGSLCQMVNSVSGASYPLIVGNGGSSGVTLSGQPLLRLGDQIPSGPGVLTILGPPAAAFVLDQGAP